MDCSARYRSMRTMLCTQSYPQCHELHSRCQARLRVARTRCLSGAYLMTCCSRVGEQTFPAEAGLARTVKAASGVTTSSDPITNFFIVPPHPDPTGRLMMRVALLLRQASLTTPVVSASQSPERPG